MLTRIKMDLSKKDVENMDIYSEDSTECESDWLDSTEEEVEKINETWKRKREKHACWVKSWMQRKQEIGKYNQQLAVLSSSDPVNYQKIMKMSIAAFNSLDLDLPPTTHSVALTDDSRMKNHCSDTLHDLSRTMNNTNQLTSSLPNISQGTGHENPLSQIKTNVLSSVSDRPVSEECDPIKPTSNETLYVKSRNGHPLPIRQPKFSSATKSFLKMIGVKLDAMPLKQQLELKMRFLQIVNTEYTNM